MNSLNLIFCGDLAPTRRFESLLLSGTPVFANINDDIKSADFSFVNLECPLTTYDKPIKKNGPALKASPECAKYISQAGFQVVGLANNHIMDYGNQGLIDTIKACRDHSIDTVGAGVNLEQAQNVYFAERKGVKIALIAIAEHEFNLSENGSAGAGPINVIDNYHQIQIAKDNADIVIVTFHGGNEYFSYPRPGLRKICKHYINLGVDAMICHHPHVPGAYEYYKDKPIVYSLGNFLFDAENPPNGWNEGYMAKLEFDIKTKSFRQMQLIPYIQNFNNLGITKLMSPEKELFLCRIESLRSTLENDNAWLSEWQKFCEKRINTYIANQYFPFNFIGLGFLMRNTPLVSLFLRPKMALKKLNLIRCESHHELLVAALERTISEKWGLNQFININLNKKSCFTKKLN